MLMDEDYRLQDDDIKKFICEALGIEHANMIEKASVDVASRDRVRSMKIIFYLWNPVPILIPDIVAAQLFILLLTCPQQQKSAPLFLLKTSLRPSETPLKAFKPYFAVCALLSPLKFCLRSRLLGVVFWLICALFQLQKCTGNCKIIFF